MLWSMRTSSSRQVSGSETVCTTAGNPLLVKPGVAFGISGSSPCPTGSIGAVLPGKVVKVVGPPEAAGQSGKLARVNVVVAPAPTAGQRSPKLPLRSASEGTFTAPVVRGLFSDDERNGNFCDVCPAEI